MAQGSSDSLLASEWQGMAGVSQPVWASVWLWNELSGAHTAAVLGELSEYRGKCCARPRIGPLAVSLLLGRSMTQGCQPAFQGHTWLFLTCIYRISD